MPSLQEKALELLQAIQEEDITDEVELGRCLDLALELVGTQQEPHPPQTPAPPPATPANHPHESLVQIYCDGSCEGNPGPGGWGTLVQEYGVLNEYSGGAKYTTNNIMEMTAAIEGLKRVPEGAKVQVTTDSQYLVKGMTQWLKGWKKRSWKKADGKLVANQALWQKLDQLAQTREITWSWVKGHAGHVENERCDQLAKAAVPKSKT